MARFRIGLFVLAAVTAVLAWALPAGAHRSASDATAAAQATVVAVTAGKPVEFKFRLNKLSAPKGVVTFRVTNSGALPHDFKILTKKTRLLSPGASQLLRVTFTKAGRFTFMCTVTGHAAAGMKGTFVVK